MQTASEPMNTEPYTRVANPDPARFAADIETFDQWDRRNVTPKEPVVFVGSSSIRMWPSAQYFPEYPVVNRGFGGSHISDVLTYLDETVLRYKPHVIVFYAGDNDIAGGKPARQVYDDYTQFVEQVLAQFSDTRFIYVPVKPSLARWNLWPEMQKANHMIERQTEADDRLFYVDIATPMLMDDGTPNPDLFLDDGLHMTKAGYDIWSAALRPVLKKAVGR
jgi:lysophospholipase L1-like esterase